MGIVYNNFEMCGIAGFFQKNSHYSLAQSEDVLRDMTSRIRHRGPDENSNYIDSKCALGMERLAIIDLQKNIYPIFSSDKSKVLIFNGEIYNYLALKNELAVKYDFKTNTDAEVIIHGYCEWGIEVFTKLRGMFAVAIWDKNKSQLTLARDRIGIKPLYYFEKDALFFFASEVKALKNVISRKLDLENLRTLTGFNYLPDSNSTILSGVKKVPPATIIEISSTDIIKKKYWELEVKPEISDLDYDSALENLENLLIESVKLHLRSDVPLGLLLSGGVDSSLLAGIITKNSLVSSLNTYTARFNHSNDESGFAQETAKKLGTTHHEIFVDTLRIAQNIESLVDVFDDLSTFDGGIITTKLLCHQIKKDSTKVLLVGEGADEMFGGYSWFGISKPPFNLLPKTIRTYLYYYATTRNFYHKPMEFVSKISKLFSDSTDLFKSISNFEIQTQLPNHFLMKVDKGSMSESVEARVPYLDHQLVEFVYSINSKFKLHGKFPQLNKVSEKYILREIAKKYISVETATRKKRGFLLPMKDVLISSQSKLKDYLLDDNALGGNMFSRNFIKSLFENSKIELINMQREYFLWRLFILEVWAKKNKYNL
jgi:asparagine synthase (glutamine-hydrolysing)